MLFSTGRVQAPETRATDRALSSWLFIGRDEIERNRNAPGSSQRLFKDNPMLRSGIAPGITIRTSPGLQGETWTYRAFVLYGGMEAAQFKL
jgi:hypothetical protein